jgi:hypothetical protein
MVRLMLSLMPENICRGSVRCPGPAISSATTTSSNDAANANTAPDSTPGRISGRITRRNAPSGVAPRFAAARRSVISNPASVANTVMPTNGAPSVVCARISPA